MLYLLLWILSSVASFFALAALLPRVGLDVAIYTALSPYIASYPAQLALIAVAVGGLFTLGLSSLQRESAPQRPVPPSQPRVPLSTVTRPVPPAPPVVPPQGQRLWLSRLTVLTRANRTEYKATRFVDIDNVKAIRPMAVILVNDPLIANNILKIVFDFVDPQGNVVYRTAVPTLMKMGENYVVAQNSEFPIKKTLEKGDWAIRIWANRNSWGETHFSVRKARAGSLNQYIGADLEIDERGLARANEIAKHFSVDDLLGT